jgi:hypothetical protein
MIGGSTWYNTNAQATADGSYAFHDLPAGNYVIQAFRNTSVGSGDSRRGIQDYQLAEQINVQLDIVTTESTSSCHAWRNSRAQLEIGTGTHCPMPRSGCPHHLLFILVWDVTRTGPSASWISRQVNISFPCVASVWKPPIGHHQVARRMQHLRGGLGQYDQVTTDIDFVVNRLGKVTGRVTDSSEIPLMVLMLISRTPAATRATHASLGQLNGVRMAFTACAPPASTSPSLSPGASCQTDASGGTAYPEGAASSPRLREQIVADFSWPSLASFRGQ